jgi:hypothetical protein
MAELDTHHSEALDVAVYALTTQARALGADNVTAAVTALTTAWRLARRDQRNDLADIVRDVLANLAAPRQTLQKLWRASSDDPYPKRRRQSTT